jgi:hypothetical protein
MGMRRLQRWAYGDAAATEVGTWGCDGYRGWNTECGGYRGGHMGMRWLQRLEYGMRRLQR